MEYIYKVLLTIFILFCSCKYFEIAFNKKIITYFIFVLFISLGMCYFQFSYFTELVARVILVYWIIRRKISKDRSIEIIAIILILETIAKCSYFILILFIPLILQINISNLLVNDIYVIQIVSLLTIFLILFKYYRSSYFINVRCDSVTYMLISTCSVIALYGLNTIPLLKNYTEEYHLYFLLLAFVYVVVINIVIYVYHNKQVQNETENRIALEQAKILKQEKDILSVQGRMIENIKHDLNYFQSIINDENKKQHLSGTIKKIDDYRSSFIFHDYLLNNFIFRLKSEMKDNDIDLKLIVTDRKTSIDLKIYNQLISIMEFVIKNSKKSFAEFSIKSLDDITVFEFMYLPSENNSINSDQLLKNENVIFNKSSQSYMICSLIMEGGKQNEK